jgi:hypothetical protein
MSKIITQIISWRSPFYANIDIKMQDIKIYIPDSNNRLQFLYKHVKIIAQIISWRSPFYANIDNQNAIHKNLYYWQYFAQNL